MLWRSCSSSVSGYSDVSAVWEVWVWNIDGHLYKISRFLLLRWQETYEGVFFEPVPFHSRFFRICLYPVWMLISNSAALDPLLPNFPCACSMTQRQTTQVICWKACTAGVLNTCTQSLLGRNPPRWADIDVCLTQSSRPSTFCSDAEFVWSEGTAMIKRECFFRQVCYCPIFLVHTAYGSEALISLHARNTSDTCKQGVRDAAWWKIEKGGPLDRIW